MSALLEIENVSKSFHGLRAVARVSFQLEASRIGALIGPNGAGKTTLFNLIAGAFARDLHLRYGYGIAPLRQTEDIDIALAVANWQAFAELRQNLIVDGGFAEAAGVPHRLRYRGRNMEMSIIW